MNSRETLIARVRQLKANDRNAVDIYTELAGRCDQPDMQETLRGMARDEVRHTALDEELLEILGGAAAKRTT